MDMLVRVGNGRFRKGGGLVWRVFIYGKGL